MRAAMDRQKWRNIEETHSGVGENKLMGKKEKEALLPYYTSLDKFE